MITCQIHFRKEANLSIIATRPFIRRMQNRCIHTTAATLLFMGQMYLTSMEKFPGEESSLSCSSTNLAILCPYRVVLLRFPKYRWNTVPDTFLRLPVKALKVILDEWSCSRPIFWDFAGIKKVK